MAKMDILMRAERVRKGIVISISSFTQTVEQFKDKHVYCLPVKSVYLLKRRFKEHSLPGRMLYLIEENYHQVIPTKSNLLSVSVSVCLLCATTKITNLTHVGDCWKIWV